MVLWLIWFGSVSWDFTAVPFIGAHLQALATWRQMGFYTPQLQQIGTVGQQLYAAITVLEEQTSPHMISENPQWAERTGGNSPALPTWATTAITTMLSIAGTRKMMIKG